MWGFRSRTSQIFLCGLLLILVHRILYTSSDAEKTNSINVLIPDSRRRYANLENLEEKYRNAWIPDQDQHIGVDCIRRTHTEKFRQKCPLPGPHGRFCRTISKSSHTEIGKSLLHNADTSEIELLPKAQFFHNELSGKASRVRLNNALRGWLSEQDTSGYPAGDVLGVSGQQYFSSFNQEHSRFTEASYPTADCFDLPFADNTFDYVIANQVLEHVPRFQTCIDEFHRVLKWDGHLLFSSPVFWPEHKHPFDMWRFMPDSLPVLFSCFRYIVVQGAHGNADMIRELLRNPGRFNKNPTLMKSALENADVRWPVYSWAVVQK